MSSEHVNRNPNNEHEGFASAKAMAELANREISNESPEIPVVPGTSELEAAIESELVQRKLAERHPDWPPVLLEIYYSPHGSARDAPCLADRISQSDIYLPEGASGPENTGLYQAVADADHAEYPPEYLEREALDTITYGDAPVRGQFIETMVRGLYDSHTIVGHIDMDPEKNAIDAEIESKKSEAWATPINRHGSFREALDSIWTQVAEVAAQERRREGLMLDRFEPEIERILHEHSELKALPELHVLASLGSFHTQFSHRAERAGIPMKRSYAEKPYVYPYYMELMRSAAFEIVPTKELMAKAYFERIFDDEVAGKLMPDAPRTRSNVEFDRYSRAVASAFSLEEIEAFHERHRADSDYGELVDMVREKGFGEIPRTADGLHETVARLHRGGIL